MRFVNFFVGEINEVLRRSDNNKMRFKKLTQFALVCLTMFPATLSFGTTWKGAYPYTQQIQGQDIVVKAIP